MVLDNGTLKVFKSKFVNSKKLKHNIIILLKCFSPILPRHTGIESFCIDVRTEITSVSLEHFTLIVKTQKTSFVFQEPNCDNISPGKNKRYETKIPKICLPDYYFSHILSPTISLLSGNPKLKSWRDTLTKILDGKSRLYNLVKKARLSINRRDLEREKESFIQRKMDYLSQEENQTKEEKEEKGEEEGGGRKSSSGPEEGVLGRLARKLGGSLIRVGDGGQQQQPKKKRSSKPRKRGSSSPPLRIVSFQILDHSVLTLTSDGVLSEWTLVSSHSEHGLTHIHRIQGVGILFCIIYLFFIFS